MSERMSPAESHVAAARREWWWRRRPPASHTRFARRVWWAGHVQLLIAFVLLLVCLPLFAVGLNLPPSEQAAAGGAAPFFARVGQVWIALLGLAMSGPFALSGVMLRGSGSWPLYEDPPIGGGPVRRVLGLIATIAGIAVLSIMLTVFVAYFLLHVVGLVEGT